MKRILSIVLAVIMVFSMTAMVSARPVYDGYFNHTDNVYHEHYINDGYYFYDSHKSENRAAIEYLYSIGILQGYGNGYYGPDKSLTRAEACAIIVRMMVESYGIRKSHTSFVDVADNAWYRAYVDTAHREGYMNGYGKNTFGPEDEVTYAQFATIILNMLGYDAVNLNGTWPANVEEIADKIGLYYRVGNFASNDTIYREDVAQMLYNALRCYMVRSYNGKFIPTGKTLGEFINKTSDNNEFNTVIGTVESVDYNPYYNNGYFVVTFEEYDADFYVSTEKYNVRNFKEGQSMTFTYYFNRGFNKYFITEITVRNANTRFYKDMEVARILPGGGNLCRVTFANGSMFNIEGSRDNLGFSVLDTISFYAEKNMYDEIGLITSVVKVIPYVEPETEDTSERTELDPGFGQEPEVFYTAEGWTRFHTANCQYVTGAEDGVVIVFDPAVHTEQTPCKICLAELYE